MVSEMNRSSMQKQMMSKGGKLNMVKGKDGKMVPDYAADGKGKMKAGGMAKAYKEGGRTHKTMESKDPNSLAAFKKLTEKKPIASKSEAKIAEGKKKPTQKYKEGGMAKKPKAKARGYGMARGGKVCKMR
jgi:hypothetical protein